MELYDQIQDATKLLQSRFTGKPTVGIILGTGLGGLAEEITNAVKIPYGDIPHFPVSTVESHAGRLFTPKVMFHLVSWRAELQMGRCAMRGGQANSRQWRPLR